MSLSNLVNQNEPTPSNRLRAFSKPLIILPAMGTIILLFGYTGAMIWAGNFENRLAPRIFIGSMAVGGQDLESAKQLVNSAVDNFLLAGTQLSIDGKIGQLPLMPTSADAGEYVTVGVDEALAEAAALHKSENKFLRPFTLIISLTHDSKIHLPISINKDQLTEVVTNTFPDSLRPAVDANFKFEKIENLWQGQATPSADGQTIIVDDLFFQLENLLSKLDPQPLVMTSVTTKPTILESHVEKLIPTAEKILNNAPYFLSFEDQTWTITDEDLNTALTATFSENKISIAIANTGLENLLQTIALEIEHPAIDARLNIEAGRVLEFQPSVVGLLIDKETTLNELKKIFNNPTENKTAAIITITVEPLVKMGEANNLGVNEILGAGTSSYKGSPTNRVKNIKNGVKLLNGLLIPPDEEFSLLNALKPFEINNGYLPELVIKGDKIEPEVGGGLCQIGTTTFRAAMNSGLPITARNNHSLVVNYYNDPSNGNPGTDATIYDPAPDLKFVNNTGHYILFQAEMNEATFGLKFSFWGTSDGRKGSYTPPEVIRWIPVGETRTTETTDLEPGKEQCQSAHIGADASFTYTITNPDGTTADTIYESHYRPLPKICLVGVEKVEENEGVEEEIVPAPEAPAAP